MSKIPCMMTTLRIPTDHLADTAALVVTQQGAPIGVVSVPALEGVKTVRLTFTRTEVEGAFTPVQAQAIESFGDFSNGYTDDDDR